MMRNVSLTKLAGTLVCTLLAGSLTAQPYIWMPGSTVDTDDVTGNRVVVVDGATDSVITPQDGWLYTESNDIKSGADPFVPAFSPDGAIVYLITGGNVDESKFTGSIYVYSTDSLISKFKLGQNPSFVNELIQPEIILSNNGAGRSEPSGFMVDHATGNVIATDRVANLVSVFEPQLDDTLSLLAEIPVSDEPFPTWTNAAGTRAYTPCLNDGNPVLEVIDLALGTPGIVNTISVPSPPSTNILYSSFIDELQFVTCGFPMPHNTDSILLNASSEVAPIDDSVLTIFSGYLGLAIEIEGGGFPFKKDGEKLPLPTGLFVINEPGHVYQLDTAANGGDGELVNSGNPVLTLNPTGDSLNDNDESLLFPPTINSYAQPGMDASRPATTSIGGSVAAQRNLDHSWLIPGGDLESDMLFPTIGQFNDDNQTQYLGSVAVAIFDSLDITEVDEYKPARPDSVVYCYVPPVNGNIAGSPTEETLNIVATVNRPINVPVTKEGTKLFGAASDTFFVNRVTSGDPTAGDGTRNSLYYSFDTDANPLVVAETDLGLIIGAVGVQPTVDGGIPEISTDLSAASSRINVGENRGDLRFSIFNSGGGTLNYTFTEDTEWLSVVPESGSSTGEEDMIAIQFDTDELPVGMFSSVITITDPAASNNPQTINISLEVRATPMLELDLSTDTITATVMEGENADSTSFTIQNSGDQNANLNYSISDDVSWLSVSPSNGEILQMETDTIDVTFNTAGLAANTYNGKITVTGNQFTINSPQEIDVTLTVEAPPSLSDLIIID